MLNNVFMERMQHFFSAQYAAECMVDQMLLINHVPSVLGLGIESTADKLSYYDTSELRETLLEVINFDYY